LQFLLIFRKALAGELDEDSGLYDLYRVVTEVDVRKEGVKGAKNFFEAKVRSVEHYINSRLPIYSPECVQRLNVPLDTL